jgi:hypothetical protein
MELRNRETGAVITESQFRNDNRNTSFPPQLTAEIIDSFGYDPVLEGPRPDTTPPYEYVARDGVEEVDGQWFTKYVVAEYDDEVKVLMDADQAKRIRADRNQRLADCDWTQLADSPLDLDGKGAWQLYRETLRLIPQQEGFPWNVTWPPLPQ